MTYNEAITFLLPANPEPLAKKYRNVGDKLLKQTYPHIKLFNSVTYNINSIEELYNYILNYEQKPSCLLKGRIQQPLNHEPRAGSTKSNTNTKWICLDLDRLNIANVEAFISLIPELQDVSYICQKTSSMYVEPEKGLSYHLYFTLEHEIDPESLKNWLMYLNLTCFAEHITLTVSGVSLKWPLDISTCQNDKLLFINPPIIDDKNAEPETVFIKKTKNSIFKIDTKKSIYVNRLKSQKIDELRNAANLPARKKQSRHIPIESCVATDIKQERGFTYFNLNNGDSWGYYHPDNDFTYIYNFKDEPVYLTEELLPDYYKKRLASLANEEVIYLAFRNKVDDKYYIGTYSNKTEILDINTTSNKEKMRDFMKENGQPKLTVVPTWTYDYDFKKDESFNIKNKFINRYVRSQYVKRFTESTKIPETIDIVLTTVFGDMKDHFINWAAAIIKHRVRTEMAWIISGIQGSGKSSIVTKILAPLIGSQYVSVLPTLQLFEKEFNAFQGHKLLVFVDESKIDTISKRSIVVDKIKQSITEPEVILREMRCDPRKIKNHCNFIFASNHYDPFQVDGDDRRFTVVPRNEKRLLDVVGMKQLELDSIVKKELQEFCNYIMSLEVDLAEAGTYVQHKDRTRLQELTNTTLRQGIAALKMGNLEHFIKNMPGHEDTFQFQQNTGCYIQTTYAELIEKFICSVDTVAITSEELQLLFYYAAGLRVIKSKFWKVMDYNGLKIDTITLDKGLTYGVEDIKWNITQKDRDLFSYYTNERG